IQIEPVLEPGLQDLERRRVPAVALEQREHTRPLVDPTGSFAPRPAGRAVASQIGGVTGLRPRGRHVSWFRTTGRPGRHHGGSRYSNGRIRSRRCSSSRWRARALSRSCSAILPTTWRALAGLTAISAVSPRSAIRPTAERSVSLVNTTGGSALASA